MCLQSYIPSEYKMGRDFIDKMKLQGSTWDQEVMIFKIVQITSKNEVTCINGQWEWELGNVQ